jgi:hypothetical protein
LFLVELGFKPVGNTNVHAFVRYHLNASEHAGAVLAADELRVLQRARNRADYDLEDRRIGLREYSMLCVERAHRVVSALASCRAPDARDSIRQAIAANQKKTRPK